MEMIENALFCMKEMAEIEVCENCRNYHTCDHSTMEENARYAIEAIEKQIPKKVKMTAGKQFPFAKVGHCPNCGETVRGNMKHCDYCGQKLDWSE